MTGKVKVSKSGVISNHGGNDSIAGQSLKHREYASRNERSTAGAGSRAGTRSWRVKQKSGTRR